MTSPPRPMPTLAAVALAALLCLGAGGCSHVATSNETSGTATPPRRSSTAATTPRRTTPTASTPATSAPATSAPATSAPATSAPAPTGVATGLTPALRRAFAAAKKAAAASGVTLGIRSGWRSAAVQEQMYRAAIKKYGSAAEASRWVLPPGSSAHVRGEAIDVRPRSGARWLERHGSAYGLCRRYDNEWWHFELRTTPGTACPDREPYARP